MKGAAQLVSTVIRGLDQAERDEAGRVHRQALCTGHVALSSLGKSLTLASPLWSVQSQSGKDGCKRLGLSPMAQN